MTRRLILPLTLPLTMLAATACELPVTWQEASLAMTESAETARVSSFTSSIVEVTTDFTLGQAAEDAAEELRSFLASQVPCSEVTRDVLTVTMDFGELDDSCVWNGRTYAGLSAITLVSAEAGQAQVLHEWIGMTDGELTMDGAATVTWDAEAGSRRVVHEVSWMNAEGEVRVGSGDRTQTLVDPDQGISAGIQIDGSREWNAPGGDWLLDIAGVQARPQDPVPQAGLYSLTIPSGKVATLAFARVDDDTIEVLLSGGREDHVWHVTSVGAEYQD